MYLLFFLEGDVDAASGAAAATAPSAPSARSPNTGTGLPSICASYSASACPPASSTKAQHA